MKMSSQQDLQQRAMVAKLSREDLEDQHLRTLEDINILKVHGRKQEEKIKKMATKLIRLANDRKKLAAQGGCVHRSGREVDLEEMIEKQQETILQLTKDRETLKQKIRSLNQQLIAQSKRPTCYSNVSSRTDSGMRRTYEGDRKLGAKSPASPPPPQQKRYGRSLLDEARAVNEGLRQQILALQEQIARNEDENVSLKNKLDAAKAMHEDEILLMRQHESSKEKSTLDGNIELIRVQRQLKEKANEVNILEARYRELDSNYLRLRNSHEDIIQETERLKTKLIDEERRALMAEASLKQGDQRQNVAYLQAIVKDMENEIAILKEANEKLTHSAFDQEKELQWRQLERDLRIQIGQLEAAMKADINDRNNILSKMNSERGYTFQLHSQSKKAHSELDRLRHENEELRDRLKIYTLSGDSVDVEELRNALSIIRQRRHAAAQKQRPDFLANVDPKDLESEFSELQANHVDTIQELDKTREMLLMQHKINKDYQIEVESVTNQMHEMKQEYEAKLARYARLLDARAARIKKLEQQLHDVAYGTKQFKIDEDRIELEADILLDDTVKLERGENLLEINVTKVTLSVDASSMLTDRDASLFVTFAFYDFDLVSTPLRKYSQLLFDFTSQFTVKVDDTFLHYLQKEGTLFELHQAMGIDHRTIASCKVRFNELLDRPQGKLRGSATLIGVNGAHCGSLDFWIRLRVPMDQAIRLYRERVKALGYLSANMATTKKQLELIESEFQPLEDENVNQLLVQILSCNHVEGRQIGVQPNVYCVYKFFDFADHDTAIIPNTNNPTFDDRQAYPVHMNADLDAYLKSEKLHVYVFDDTDPDMTSYLGKAVIDLIPLAHNKPICAPFELKMSNGEQNGSVEFAARWQLAYKPPPGVLKDEPLYEDEAQEVASIIKKPPMTPKKPHPPNASSTPKPLHRKAMFPSIYELPSKERADVIKQQAERDEETSDKIEQDEPASEIKQPIPEVDVSLPDDAVSIEKTESLVSDHDDDTSSVKRRKVQFVDDTFLPSSVNATELPATSQLITVDEPELPVETLIQPTRDVKDKYDDLAEFLSDLEEDLTPTRDADETPRVPLEPEVIVVEPSAPKTLPRTRQKQDSPPPEEEESLPKSEEESIPEEVTQPTIDGLDVITEEAEAELPTVKDTETHEENASIEEIKSEVESLRGSPRDEIESKTSDHHSDSIRIRINHLTLNPESSVWDEKEVEQMFVEFDFLGSVEETPDAVSKPTRKDEKLVYNFETNLELNAADNADRRDALSSMLTSGHTSFKMTVVSEPIADEEDDCMEIGTASVDLASILKSGRDIINEDVIVTDLRDSGSIVGKLNISVEALAVLQMIKNELRARLAESDE